MKPILTLLTFVLVLVAPSIVAAAGEFTALTSLPGLPSVVNADSLAGFFNQLYILSVGAAAVLAVIQITRAGIIYSLGDSITEKREARHLITMSVLGLVLVLSPYVVFSIINRDILDLRINVSTLYPRPGEGAALPNQAPETDAGQPAPACGTIANGARVSTDAQQQCCDAQPACSVTLQGRGNYVCSCQPVTVQEGCQRFASGNTVVRTQEQFACCRAQTACRLDNRGRAGASCRCE